MLDDLENKLSFMFTHLFHLLFFSCAFHYYCMKINKFPFLLVVLQVSFVIGKLHYKCFCRNIYLIMLRNIWSISAYLALNLKKICMLYRERSHITYLKRRERV